MAATKKQKADCLTYLDSLGVVAYEEKGVVYLEVDTAYGTCLHIPVADSGIVDLATIYHEDVLDEGYGVGVGDDDAQAV